MADNRSMCCIMCRSVTLPNGHVAPSGPFIVFPSREEAEQAVEMVKSVSSDTPMLIDAAYYLRGPYRALKPGAA